MKITLIGHSTVLVEAAGLLLVTDPFFSGFTGAYKRLRQPDRKPLDEKPADIVLVSHGHFDHIDLPYLMGLGKEVPIFCPKRYIGPGKDKRRLSPWATAGFKGLTITAVPAKHPAPTVGYVISDGVKTIYFSGDTLYAPFMAEVGSRFKLDAALMPVAGYRIPLIMGNRDAVKAARDLKAPRIIPIHRDITPRPPFLRTGETVESFKTLMARECPDTGVILLGNGEGVVI